MDKAELLQKGITFQDLIVLVRELQNKTDNEIALDVFLDKTSESTRKIVAIMLQHNSRLVIGKVQP